MVKPSASVGRRRQWISHCVDNLPFPEVLRLDFPDLLESQPVRLRLAVAAKIELLDDLLGQTTMATLSEKSDSGMKFHSTLE